MAVQTKRGPFGIYIHEGCRSLRHDEYIARVGTHTDTQSSAAQNAGMFNNVFLVFQKTFQKLPIPILLRLFTPTGPHPAF